MVKHNLFTLLHYQHALPLCLCVRPGLLWSSRWVTGIGLMWLHLWHCVFLKFPFGSLLETEWTNLWRWLNDIFIIYSCSLITPELNRVASLDDLKRLTWLSNIDWTNIRDRPAAITVNISSIDDTSYFDTFPDVQIEISKLEQQNLIVSLLPRTALQSRVWTYGDLLV